MDYIDLRKIPDSELEIMQIIWDNPAPVSRQTIENALKKQHKIALTTLLTLLTRLSEKGYVLIERKGRESGVYYPLVSKRDYLASQSKRFLELLCDGSLADYAGAICDSGLTINQIEELRYMLDRQK